MIDPRELAESGILLVDKPVDWTSHDVVNCIRRRFAFRKVGHCGTLDPNATGLLVILIGRATALSGRLMGQDKTYVGTIRLGLETTTQDAEGQVTRERPVGEIAPAALEAAVASFRGPIRQTPPMVSAVKKGGRPLYKLARKGIEIEREARDVTIHEFVIESVALPDLAFRVTCSKGTYVRTLAADLGEKLGCGAHLLTLRRTRSGRFLVDQASPMDAIKQWEREELFRAMITLERIPAYLE